MRALYITSLVLWPIFFILLIYYSAEYDSARWNSYDYSYGYDYGYTYYGPDHRDVGGEFALIAILFCLFACAKSILGLIKVKTSTNKVLSIIGLCVSGIMLLWSAAMAADPGGIGLNEVGPVYLIFIIIMLAFSIVGLIQAVKYHNRLKQPAQQPVVVQQSYSQAPYQPPVQPKQPQQPTMQQQWAQENPAPAPPPAEPQAPPAEGENPEVG